MPYVANFLCICPSGAKYRGSTVPDIDTQSIRSSRNNSVLCDANVIKSKLQILKLHISDFCSENPTSKFNNIYNLDFCSENLSCKFHDICN